MKAKHAIGITVNGNEVRAAFLSLVRGKARIKALESTTLDAPLEQTISAERNGAESLNDRENALYINEPRISPDENDPTELKSSDGDQNVSKVYALLDKFQNQKANVAINTPHLTVKYDFINREQVPNKKKRLKDRFDIWGGDEDDMDRGNKYIPASDDKTLNVDYEYHPPVIDLIEEVNQFRASQLNLVLMDTNELALVDLVKEIYKFEKTEITAVVYIEQDFSRVIFLKGRDIYHITPTLHKGSMSDDVLEVLYSRIIFAQDHYFIPEINKILVAGHSSRLKAKYYFRQKFPSSVVGYLNSKKIQSDLRFKDRGLLFSRYAVPIALAWKALLKDVVKTKDANFLPDYILERQTMPKLAAHGYLLLFLLIGSVSLFTWALVAKNLEIMKISRSIENIKQQVDNNKALTERVHAFDGQIVEIEHKISLVDSFSQGYDETTLFLQTLNKGISEVGDIWLTDLRKSGTKVDITGTAMKRDKIPILANRLGGANLKKVTRSEYLGSDVFIFQLEKKLDEDDSKKNLTIFSMLENRDHEEAARADLFGRSATNGTNGFSGKDQSIVSTSGQRKNNATNGNTSEYVYGLKLGTYDSQQEAAAIGKTLRSKGYEIQLSTVKSEGKVKYVLIVGAFDKNEDAQALSKTFSNEAGINNKIIRFKKSG